LLKLPFDFHQEDGKPGDLMKPQPIFGKAEEINAGSDAAEIFARWVTASDNQHFNTVIVNRLWKKMFGIALLDQFDDMTDKSQSALPELEAHLEKLVISLHYDMRAFLAIIASTRTYQSAVMHDEVARGDAFHFQAPVLRRMTAEQVWDSIVALANHEPDARDLKRELRNGRRIGVSQMACDAYLNFDGTKLLDMAYARLQAELDLEKRDKAVKEELIVAKRNGDKAREIDLRHQEGAIDRERGETYVKDFIMPILTNLANTKAGPEAKIVEDELYKMNANPRVMQTETWKRLYVPGYGPAPKTAAQMAAEAEAEKQKLIALARKLGVPEKEQADFMSYCGRGKTEWLRASELDSPAPRGHFLRTMGQSDRDFVENANPNASIPQALALMNGELISRACLLSPYSPLMVSIQQCTAPEAKVEAAYLSLLSRKPTAQEKLIWSKAATSNDSIDHLIYALLNTKQFLFIQ
jgi:hypothetical protein